MDRDADRDPDHWLYRLSAAEWLRAAANELAAAEAAFVAKNQRAAVAQARRAAGMALNALLRVAPVGTEERYGRSYMDHLRALAEDEGAPAPVRAAARRLLEMPQRLDVVVLGKGDARQAEPAAVILTYVRELLAPAASA